MEESCQSAEYEIIRYTVSQLFDLNHGKYHVSGKAHDIFSSYPEPRCPNYQNKHNHRFVTQKTKTPTVANIIKSEHIYSDKKIINDIRNIINVVSKGSGKVQLAIKRMNGLTIPATQAGAVAKVFHHAMIDCDFLIQEYLDVLFGFTNSDRSLIVNIYNSFITSVIEEFKSPSTFEDSHTESKVDKEFRWRHRNCLIIAHLATRTYPDTPEFELIRNKMRIAAISGIFMGSMFSEISPENDSVIQIVVDVWTLLKERISIEAPDDHKKYLEILQQIVDSPDYKVTVKVRLMNLFESD